MVVWRRWIFPILMVVIFGLIAASLVKVAFFPDEQAVAEVPTAVITDPVVAVERGSIVNQLDVAATIARDEQVVVKSEINGTVIAVHVGVGSRVSAGQALFTVKQDDPVREHRHRRADRGRCRRDRRREGTADLDRQRGREAHPADLPRARHDRAGAAVPADQRADRGDADHRRRSGAVHLHRPHGPGGRGRHDERPLRGARPIRWCSQGSPRRMGITVGTVEDALLVPDDRGPRRLGQRSGVARRRFGRDRGAHRSRSGSATA